MGNFLTDFANNAKKKAVQFEQSFNSAPRPAAPAPAPAAPQFSPLAQQRIMARNPSGGAAQIAHGPVMPTVTPIQHFKPLQQIIPTVIHQAPQVAQAFGLGLGRVGTGIVQDTSGLVDLATPGHGTSRVTKAFTNAGKNLDTYASHLNPAVQPAYKIGQATGTVASFIAPGGIAAKAGKGITALPRVANAIDHTAPVLNGVRKVAAPLTDRIAQLDHAILPGKDALGRVAGSIAHGAVRPSNLINAGAATAMQVGHQSGQGQKITPGLAAGEFGTNAAFGAALHGAGQVAQEALPGVARATKASLEAQKAALAKVQNNMNIDSEQAGLRKEMAGVQKRIDQTPVSDAYSNNQLQAKMDNLTSRHAAAEANRQPLSIKEKLLSAQPGLTVGGPNALKYQLAKKQGKVFDGVDGKPRFEIDDSGATIKNPNGSTLGEVMDHPKFYDNYPDAKNIKVEYAKSNDYKGHYDKGNNILTLNPSLPIDKQLGTALHEVTHYVQHKEGFATGTSPEANTGTKLSDKEFNDLYNRVGNNRIAAGYWKRAAESGRPIDAIIAEEEANRGAKLPADKVQAIKMSGSHREAQQALDMSEKSLQREIDAKKAGFEAYHNNAAEAEARAVEKRANLPMSERYKTTEPSYKSLAKDGIHKQPMLSNKQLESLSPEAIDGLKQQGFKGVSNGKRTVRFDDTKSQPATSLRSTFYDSLDVPKEDLIIKHDGGTAMSVDKPTAPSTKPKEVPPQPSGKARLPASRGTGGVSSGNGTTKPTGIVDKHLQELQDAHKEIVNAEAADIASQQPAKSDLYNKVVQHGGISSSAYESLPNYVKRSGGLSADKMAQELGYPSEDHLIQDLQAHTDINNSRLTPTQIREQAITNLESGKSQYNAEYKDIKDRLAQRQDELSLYPKGTNNQVKVTNKPQKMSDAELQSLAKTPEGIQPKKGNDVIQRNDKKVIRNADAERQVQEVLKKGGSTDEALQSYMAATGVDLQTAVKDVRRVAADSGLGFTGGKNPLIGTIKIPKVQAGDAHQPLLNADYVAQHEQAIGGDALKAFNSLSEHDKTLLKDIETHTVDDTATRAENPQAFKDAEKAIRTYYDTRHAYDQHLGIDVGYRQNYLRQLFTKAEDQANVADQVNIKGGNKRPGYTQTRTKDTLNTHVGDALQRDINGASANHAKLTYAQGLNEAFPGKTNTSGQLVRDDTGNYMQLTNRYGQGVTAQKDIAQQINRRSWQPTDNKALAAYDKANAGIKFIKLGGGAFHALTEAGNFIGQQLSSGKLFTNPSASGKVLKTFFSPKTMDKELATFRKNGTIDNAALAGLKHGYKEILADASVSVDNKLSKYTGIKALHDATFKREIPYAKLKMFEQGTKGLDAHNPADLAIMRTKAREINQIFGGINRDVQGITPAAFKRMQRFVLATDFTESKIHTASDALTDWKSPAGRLARQTVIGKALLFAGLAAGAGALGGEYKNKSPQEVAKNILGKFADPSFSVGKYKVGLPATHISEFTKPLSPLFRKDGGDKFSGLQRYGTNRLAAVPSEILQLRTNKDASGSRIYGKDYKANGGNPISAGKTALNVAGGFVPIPVAQGIGVGTGKTNIPSAIANTIGLRVSDPSQFTKTATSGNTPVDKLKATEKQQSKDLKASLSPEDYKLSQLSKDDRAKLIKDGSYTADKFKGLDNYVNAQKQKLGMKVPADKTNNGISAHSQKVLNEYNKLSSDQIKQKAYKENDYDYKVAQAKYENDKANNKLSKSQLISRADTVRKAQVGSGFSKDTRDIYGLSKNDVYNLITTDPNGKQIANDLLAYGDALQKNGIENNKYRTLKTGAEAFKPKTTVGQTSTASSRHASQMALLKAFKTPYSDLVKSQSKGAQLARSAKLGKKRA